MPKKQKELTPEQEHSLFKKLYSTFSKSKFIDQEINPQAAKSQELPSQTTELPEDRSGQSLSEIITGLADQTRSQENDRYLRYKDYAEMCLSGPTKISLLNGKSISIQDWTENLPDKYFYVYSYDIPSNSIVPGLAHSPRVTRTNADMIEIELSNGQTIQCTPDHKFLIEPGEYVPASHLQSDDILVSMSTKISSKNQSSLPGYEMFKYKENPWQFTHRMVAENEFQIMPQGKTNVHHINEDKRNNSPDNLVIISGRTHQKIHNFKNFIQENSGKLFENKENQFKNSFFQDKYFNSENKIYIKNIKNIKKELKVYDITVNKYNNFLLDCGVFVHNCTDPIIGGSLETYADEATQSDEGNKMITIKAHDKKTQRMLEEFFLDKICIEEKLWNIAFETCKYGDNFYEIIFNKKLDDILYIKYVSPYKMFRKEKEGKLQGFEYLTDSANAFMSRKEGDIYKQITGSPDRSGTRKINPYKIIHFKIEDHKYEPYGRSLLDTSRIVWKQLTLLEDAVIVYRLVRAPERRVWYIDTGQLSTDKAIDYTRKVKEMLRKKPIIDPTTGSISDTKKAISYVEDFWIPVRAGSTGNKIETLPGAQRLGEIDDLEYFRSKILYYMRIPKAFFTDEASVQLSGKSLASMDIFFAKAVERIQNFIEKGLYKLAYIYLIIKNVSPEKIKSVEIKLTDPSIWAQSARYENLTQKFNLLGTIKSSQIFPDVWILKEVMKLDDEEIISVIGLMQAQAAGQDLVALLTGEPNPFASGMPVPGAETEQQIQAGMEQEMGTPPGASTEAPGTSPEGDLPPQEAEGEGEAGALEGHTETSISSNDMAIKALLNLENKNLTLKEREKMLLEVVKLKQKIDKNQKDGTKKLLGIIGERLNSVDRHHNGLTYAINIGSLSGLFDDLKQIRGKSQNKSNELISEQDLLNAKSPVKSKNFLNSTKQNSHLNLFEEKMKNLFYPEPKK